MTATDKTYLSDGVWAAWDGFAVVLSTVDDRNDAIEIILEPQTYENLRKFVERLPSSRADATGHP